jgi:hypothetical protein
MKEGIEGKLRCGERVVGGDPTRRYRTVKALRRQGLQQTYILYLTNASCRMHVSMKIKNHGKTRKFSSI